MLGRRSLRGTRMRHTNNLYRKQQGAAAVFVAIALIPLLIATMLAIEVGRVYYAHRSLQKAANLAALDTARLMSGCTGNSRSEEHTSELQSLMRISYAVFCLKKKNNLTQE